MGWDRTYVGGRRGIGREERRACLGMGEGCLDGRTLVLAFCFPCFFLFSCGGRVHNGGVEKAHRRGRSWGQAVERDVALFTSGEAKRRESLAGLVLEKHRVRVGLALGGVGRSDGVNDRLRFFVSDFCKEAAFCCQWRRKREREREL